MLPRSGATTVASDNINEAVAGDTIVLDVHARDHRQHEVQIVAVAAQAVDTVPEVQRVHVGSSAFTLTFRGATTSSFALGGTEATLEGLIEDLPTITGGVTVTEETSSDGTIDASDTFLVEFSGVYGDVPLLSTTATKVHEVTKGDAPYVREIQTFYCDATSGNLAVDFRDYDTTASLDVSTATVADLATELAAVGIAVSAWRHDDKTDSALTICGSGNTVAEMVYVEFLAGQQKRAKFPTSKAHISAVFHSFRLIFGRAIISRNGLEAWMLFPERARAKHSH